MLVSGIIAVLKVISLKTGDGELHRPCVLQPSLFKFSVVILLSMKPRSSDSGEMKIQGKR